MTPQATSRSLRLADAALVAAVRAHAARHGAVVLKALARTLGCSSDVLGQRLRSSALRDQLTVVDPTAADLLTACLAWCDKHAAADRRLDYAPQSREYLLRAVRDGLPLPQDWCGPGLAPTEVAGPDCLPGSEARIALYARRVARGEAVFSRADWRGDQPGG